MAREAKSKNIGDGFKDHVDHGMVKDVTTDNYAGKAAAVANFRGGEDWGCMICPLETSRQWGAWLDYFKHLGRAVPLMKMVGQARAASFSANGYWVPTPFPHMFDKDRMEISDRNASDAFEAAQEKRRAEVAKMGSEEERLRQAQAAVERVKKGMQLPKDHNWKKDRSPPPVLACRDPKRWHDPEQLRASRDRMLARQGMEVPTDG